MSTFCQSQHYEVEEAENDSQLSVVLTLGGTKIDEHSPSCFWLGDDSITAVACGYGHAAVVTKKGCVLTFGSNRWGQSGTEEEGENSGNPKIIKSMKALLPM
ncbi:hypothetical protein D918_04755 [Trichuris suis]|nr:hypothetical protein D918_04755 [Trichuris suis]